MFFDEVGELPLAMQPKLLNLIQLREYEPLGAKKPSKADVRFVFATHRDLEAMVKDGTFREDLFHRINVVPIVLPPLRERRDDFEPLVAHFAKVFGAQNNRPNTKIADDALSLIAAQRWPGNVRQLQNFIERLMVLAPEGDVIDAATVQKELTRAGLDAKPNEGTGETLPERRKDAERAAVEEALQKAGGNRSVAARILGVSRRTLYNKLEALGLMDAS